MRAASPTGNYLCGHSVYSMSVFGSATKLVVSPGFPPGGGKGISTIPPITRTGECGPITAFALRAEKPAGKRKKWDNRHQLVWPNDYQHVNVRNYFDRFVDRPGEKSIPRRALRPHWVLDVAKKPAENDVYRIFNPRTAQWEDQWQWVPKPLPQDLFWSLDGDDASGAPMGSGGDLAASGSAGAKSAGPAKPKRVRTPRKPDDLRVQRKLEKEWDRNHAVVYSRFNQHKDANTRSYFDRWKDEGSALNNNEVSWKLGYDKKGFSGKSISQPDLFKDRGGLPGQPGWVSNFSSQQRI